MKIAKLAVFVFAAVLADSTAVSSLDMPVPHRAAAAAQPQPLLLLTGRDGAAVAGGIALVSQ